MTRTLLTPSLPATVQNHAVLYVDDDLIVVDKPTRLLSVPGRGEDKQDCLIARVKIDYPDALIVHRLDFDTSGLVVLARGKVMHRRLSIAFQEREVDKRYVAVVDGKMMAANGGSDLKKLKSGLLAKAIKAGDAAVERIVRDAMHLLGRAIGGTVNLLAPDVVVLGGGLVEALPRLALEEVKAGLKETAMASFLPGLRVVEAELGDDATTLGAAALAAEAAAPARKGRRA